ncbi:MAG TPA: diguanylate cyclase [Dissulfurispiraceae bacterium]|nr:diguanylate cyclase [Dissulfurispiraceae bacterium]
MTDAIVFISRDIVLTSIIQRLLGAFQVSCFKDMQHALDLIYHSQPRMLIFDVENTENPDVHMLNDLKSDPVFGQIPLLVILPDTLHRISWETLFADDYLRRRDVEGEILTRVALCLSRSDRIVEINPLTRLPGNITITRQIQHRLDAGDIFALAYADLDYFKPFNDKYGFSRGDEVIRMVGRLILNLVREEQPSGSFVGHVGGDDYVFITLVDIVEAASERILQYHEQIVPTFYDPEDRERGSIISIDRENRERVFPLMSLSIGVAHNRVRSFSHYGEMVEVAAEMKKYSKTKTGSSLSMDRRGPSGLPAR